ncbi:MAG: autotransporter domain-containing protein [Devosia sp.]
MKKSILMRSASVAALALLMAPVSAAFAQNVVISTPQSSVYIDYPVNGSVINNSQIGAPNDRPDYGLEVDGDVTGDVVNTGQIYASERGIDVDGVVGGVVRNDGLVSVVYEDSDIEIGEAYASSDDIFGIRHYGDVEDGQAFDLETVNTGVIDLDVDLSASSAGDYAYADSNDVIGIYQYAEAYPDVLDGGDVSGTLGNSGSISASVSADANAGEDGYAEADASATGISQYIYAAGYGTGESRLYSGDATGRLTNSGAITIETEVEADAAEYGYASAYASAVGIDQYIGSRDGTATAILTNSGSIVLSATADAAIPSYGYDGDASASATGISQSAYAGESNATASLTNSGDIDATAVARVAAGQLVDVDESLEDDWISIEADAYASGIYQYVYGYTAASADLVNSGDLTSLATAEIDFGSQSNLDYEAYASASASAEGINQIVYAYGPASGTLENSGDITAIATVDANFGADAYGNYVSAESSGIDQTVSVYDFGSATGAISNSGTIISTAAAEVTLGSDSSASIDLAASGTEQYIEGQGVGQLAPGTVLNDGELQVLADVSGVAGWDTSINAGDDEDSGAISAVGISQDVYAYNLAGALASATNDGAIDVGIAGEFAFLGDADFAFRGQAAGIYQIVNGFTGSASAVNNGSIEMGFDLNVDSEGVVDVSGSIAGIVQGGSGEFVDLSATNNGGISIDADLSGVADRFDAASVGRLEAVGIAQQSDGVNTSLTMLNSADIDVDVDASGYDADLSGGSTTYEFAVSAYGAGYRGQVGSNSVGSLDITNSGMILVDVDSTLDEDLNAAYVSSEAFGFDLRGGSLSGTVLNDGELDIEATSDGEATAIGINVVADSRQGLVVTNAGAIETYAATSEFAPVRSVGVLFDVNPDGSDYDGDNGGVFINNGGSIASFQRDENGDALGEAIDFSNAADALIVLAGTERDGFLLGNILTNSLTTISVVDGQTVYSSGSINNGSNLVGSMSIGDNGTFLVGNNEEWGPARVYTNALTVDTDGTIAFALDQDDDTPLVDYGQVNVNTANLSGSIKGSFAAGLYANTPYTYEDVIIAATRNGTFDQATSNTPLMNVVETYDGNTIDLTATRVAFGDVEGLTDNQQAVADSIESFYDELLALPDEYADLIGEFFSLEGVEAYQDALDQLSGVEYAQGLQAQLGSFNELNQLLAGRWRGASLPVEPLGYAPTHQSAASAAIADATFDNPTMAAIWAKGFAAIADSDGDGNAQGYGAARGGGYIGADIGVSSDLAIGIAGGYVMENLEFDNGNTLDYSGFQVAAYGNYDNGATFARGVVGYGSYTNEAERTVTIGNISETATAEYASSAAHVYGEIGHRVMDLGSVSLAPVVGVGYTVGTSEGFTETGLTAGNLVVDEATASSLIGSIGLQVEGQHDMGGASLSTRARIAYEYEFLEGANVNASFAGAPGGTGFTVVGENGTGGYVSGGLGATLSLTPSTDVSFDYRGRFGEGYLENAGSLSLQQRF